MYKTTPEMRGHLFYKDTLMVSFLEGFPCILYSMTGLLTLIDSIFEKKLQQLCITFLKTLNDSKRHSIVNYYTDRLILTIVIPLACP